MESMRAGDIFEILALFSLGLLYILLLIPSAVRQWKRWYFVVDPLSLEHRRRPWVGIIYGLLLSVPSVLFIIARQLQAIEASDNPQREFDVDPFLTDFLAILAYILAPIIIALLRPLAEHPLGLWDILLMVLVAVPVILHDITPQLDILFDATFPDKWQLQYFSSLKLTSCLLVLLLILVIRPLPDTGLGRELRFPRKGDYGYMIVCLLLLLVVFLPAGVSTGALTPARDQPFQDGLLTFATLFFFVSLPLEVFFRGFIQNLFHAYFETRRDIDALALPPPQMAHHRSREGAQSMLHEIATTTEAGQAANRILEQLRNSHNYKAWHDEDEEDTNARVNEVTRDRGGEVTSGRGKVGRNQKEEKRQPLLSGHDDSDMMWGNNSSNSSSRDKSGYKKGGYVPPQTQPMGTILLNPPTGINTPTRGTVWSPRGSNRSFTGGVGGHVGSDRRRGGGNGGGNGSGNDYQRDHGATIVGQGTKVSSSHTAIEVPPSPDILPQESGGSPPIPLTRLNSDGTPYNPRDRSRRSSTQSGQQQTLPLGSSPWRNRGDDDDGGSSSGKVGPGPVRVLCSTSESEYVRMYDDADDHTALRTRGRKGEGDNHRGINRVDRRDLSPISKSLSRMPGLGDFPSQPVPLTPSQRKRLEQNSNNNNDNNSVTVNVSQSPEIRGTKGNGGSNWIPNPSNNNKYTAQLFASHPDDPMPYTAILRPPPTQVPTMSMLPQSSVTTATLSPPSSPPITQTQTTPSPSMVSLASPTITGNRPLNLMSRKMNNLEMGEVGYSSSADQDAIHAIEVAKMEQEKVDMKKQRKRERKLKKVMERQGETKEGGHDDEIDGDGDEDDEDDNDEDKGEDHYEAGSLPFSRVKHNEALVDTSVSLGRGYVDEITASHAIKCAEAGIGPKVPYLTSKRRFGKLKLPEPQPLLAEIESPRWCTWREKYAYHFHTKWWRRFVFPHWHDYLALFIGTVIYTGTLAYHVHSAESRHATDEEDVSMSTGWAVILGFLFWDGLVRGFLWRMTGKVYCSALVGAIAYALLLHVYSLNI